MTRLRMAALFVAVVAGDCAALMLVVDQLIDFGVAAAICAGSSVAAGLIAYVDDEDARRQHELGKRRRKVVARGRAVIWEGRDQQAASAADQHDRYAEARAKNGVTHPDSLTGRAHAYAWRARRPSTRSRHDEPAAGLGASSDG
jgi:hypothetical protein